MKKIAIVGSGSWGTALAVVASHNADEVLVWARSADVADDINNNNQNSKNLAGIKLADNIKATANIKQTCDADALILVVPAQTLRATCEKLKNANLNKNTALVIACKGVEQETNLLMSEIVNEILPNNPVAVLSGANFAKEIASGLPACTTIACENRELGMRLIESLSHKTFRSYYSQDIIGAQVSGAVKNVLAIACGIAIGRGLGENTSAAIVTRGMAEIARLCVKKGGQTETLMGLSGVGDIMLTCGSKTSRNMSFGVEVGKGKCPQALMNSGVVTEGVATSKSVVKLAKSLNVEMPICKAVADILFESANIDEQIKDLLSRPLGAE